MFQYNFFRCLQVSNLEEPIDRAEEAVCPNSEVQADLNMTDLSLLFVKLANISDELKTFQEKSLCQNSTLVFQLTKLLKF